MLGLGNPLLPSASGVGGISGTRTVLVGVGKCKPGQKGASHALVILRLCRPLFDEPTYVCLPGRYAHQGPPPSGGDPSQGLCVKALHLRRAARGPRDPPWGESTIPIGRPRRCERAVKMVGT